MKELKNRGIPYKIYLSEDEMPRYWYLSLIHISEPTRRS